jgi:hypothetical protein
MVERPIKKSERQAKPEGESSESVAQAPPTVPPAALPTRNVERPTLNKDKDKESGSRENDRSSRENDRGSKENDRGKGRGRGKGRDEEPRQMVSPALLRGPKPTKSKPPAPEVEEVIAEATEAIAEDVMAAETPEAASSESA